MSDELRVDPKRYEYRKDATGIYVRALDPGGNWATVDIAELDKRSLTAWLRSRGGENVWAEEVVYTLLGHDQ